MKKKGIFNRADLESLRAQTLERVVREELSLKDAALILELSYPQAKRLLSRFKSDGQDGLVHRLRGQPSNRAFKNEDKQAIINLYRQSYPDFGPTLAAEKIAGSGYQLHHETLRRWLIQESLWEKYNTPRK